MRLQGIAVSPGIAIGKAQVLMVQEVCVLRRSLPPERVEGEVARFHAALEATIRDVEALRERARSKLSEELLAIFDVHVIILKDPSLVGHAVQQIRTERVNAEYALQGAIQTMAKGLLATDDPYFQERAADLDDLNHRILHHLSGSPAERPVLGGSDVVILADTLTPSETGALSNQVIAGFATEHGGRTSHTAIIARSLEIPAVVGVKGLMQSALPDLRVIVDGLEGAIFLDPTEEEVAEYRRRAQAYARHLAALRSHARKDSVTVDGHRLRLSANVDLTGEIRSAMEAGAEGVGLYRSEFLFLECAPNLPTEEQHFEAYEKIAETFYPHRAVIRTLDLGGEKYFHEVLDRGERNPVLGVRAIRFCLKHPEIFKAQLRGLLRASSRKNLAILLPLISTLEELEEALAVLQACKSELRARAVPFDETIPLGIMVEVPSCALTAEAFAPKVDFFSIGTNDLIQYLLAIDRNNDSVAHLYDPMHPAVLRCIAHVCEAAAAQGKPVTVCGEVGADPGMTPLLLGLGVQELSMTPASILEVRERVRGLSYRACHRLARKALKASSGTEVAQMVRAAFKGKKG
jgi:phosphotransferase system enzyme I (PtsI)